MDTKLWDEPDPGFSGNVSGLDRNIVTDCTHLPAIDPRMGI